MRYAGALIDLAEEAGKLKQIETDLADLDAMLGSSEDLNALIAASTMGQKNQTEALGAIAKKAGFQELTSNFLGVLVNNRRINKLAEILSAFRRETAKRSGIVNVQVQVAQDMTLAQMNALREALKKGLKQDVQIEVTVKPDILGGMVVTVGSQMIDDSVRRKLEKLQIAMGGHSNQNFNTTKKEA